MTPYTDEQKADLAKRIEARAKPLAVEATRDLTKRLRTLQTSHPFKLEVLATTKGGEIAEARYHGRFNKYRMEGEWFLPVEAIKREIRKLNRGQE